MGFKALIQINVETLEVSAASSRCQPSANPSVSPWKLYCSEELCIIQRGSGNPNDHKTYFAKAWRLSVGNPGLLHLTTDAG